MTTQVLWSDLDTWLSEQAENTIETPYEIEITGVPQITWFDRSDTTDTIGYILKNHRNKYVSIEFSNTVKNITTSLVSMEYAFYNCSNLVNIDISAFENVESMNHTFTYCASLKLDNIKSLKNVIDLSYMFMGCTSLEVIAMDGLQFVNDITKLFMGCTALRYVTMNSIGTMADKSLVIGDTFTDCYNLESVSINNILNANDLRNLFFNLQSLISVEARDLKNLTNVYRMFRDCTSLTSVDLTGSTNITNAEQMFYGCTSLTEVDDVFYHLISALDMFNGCTSLKNIELLSLVNIDDASSMFRGCTSLTEITLSSLVKIGDANAMFLNCTSLTNYHFDSLQTLMNPSAMFNSCSSLQEIVLNAEIFNNKTTTTVQPLTNGCTALQSITLSKISCDSAVFFSSDSNTPVLKNVVLKGYDSSMSSNFDFSVLPALETFEVENFPYVKNIYTKNLTHLKKVRILNFLRLTKLSSYGFSTNIALEDVEIKQTPVLDNAEALFQGCVNLKNVVIDDTSFPNTYNTKYMFDGCINLKSVDLNCFSAVKNADFMFSGCTSLTNIDLSKFTSLTTASNMFLNCTGLKNVTLNNLSIETTDHMFELCTSLETVNIGNFTTSNCDMIFKGCSSLKVVNISSLFSPSSCTGMFMRCSSLESIDLSNLSVDSVEALFSQCTALKEVHGWNIPQSATMTDCFNECVSIEHIYINSPIKDDTQYHAWFLTKDEDNNQTGVKIFNIDGTSNTTVVPSSGDYDYSVTGKVDEIYSGSSITESDIEKVIATKYPMTQNKDAIDPTKDGFVLWAKEGSEVRTNIIKSTKYFIGESTSLTPKNDMEIFIQGQGVVVTLDNGTIPFGTIIKAYALNDTQISYYAGTEIVTNEIEVDGETQTAEETVDVTKTVSLVTGSKVEMGYINNKWQIIGTYGAVWN